MTFICGLAYVALVVVVLSGSASSSLGGLSDVSSGSADSDSDVAGGGVWLKGGVDEMEASRPMLMGWVLRASRAARAACTWCGFESNKSVTVVGGTWKVRGTCDVVW